MSKKSSKKRSPKAKKAPETEVETPPEAALSEDTLAEPAEGAEDAETPSPEILNEESPGTEEESSAGPEPAPDEEPAGDAGGLPDGEPSAGRDEAAPEEETPEDAGTSLPDDAPAEEASAEEAAVDGDELLGEEGVVPTEAPPQFPLKRVIESILFASQKPVSVKELQSVLKGSFEADKENPHTAPFAKIKEPALREAMEELAADYDASGRSFEVKESASGWQLVTRPEFYPWLRQLYPENRSARLSAPAMETLAIIAYRQPITRADIEAIRGVAVDGVMQTLLDRSLVKIAGRAEIPGRPLLYETTQFFMEHFGLAHLGDLPNAQELRKIVLPTAATAEEAKPAGKKVAADAAPETPASAPADSSGEASSSETPPVETAAEETHTGDENPSENPEQRLSEEAGSETESGDGASEGAEESAAAEEEEESPAAEEELTDEVPAADGLDDESVSADGEEPAAETAEEERNEH